MIRDDIFRVGVGEGAARLVGGLGRGLEGELVGGLGAAAGLLAERGRQRSLRL